VGCLIRVKPSVIQREIIASRFPDWEASNELLNCYRRSWHASKDRYGGHVLGNGPHNHGDYDPLGRDVRGFEPLLR